MSARMEEIHVIGSGQAPAMPARAVRSHVATVLASAALFLAVAGVVFAPGFVRNEPVATQQTQALLTTVGAALRQQSPLCLLETC